MNYLEQLASEWYEFSGYFVRRNVRVGKRAAGGHQGELDVVAFHPTRRHLVHVEASTDTDSWSEREKKFRRKFGAGQRHIPSLFEGFDLPGEAERIVLLLYGSNKNRSEVGGGRLVLVSEFLEEIFAVLKDRKIENAAIPEHHPILRTLQLVAGNRDRLWRVLDPSR